MLARQIGGGRAMTLYRKTLLAAGLVAIVVAAAVTLFLRQEGMLHRLHLVTPAEFPSLGDGHQASAADLYRGRIEAAKVDVEGPPETVARNILWWWMNQVTAKEKQSGLSAAEVLLAVEAGRGLICTGLSLGYQEALAAFGFKTRRVALSRNLTSTFDTHVTVEAKIGRRWVILDPTFNVGFERGGSLLGAQDIWRALRDGTAGSIRPAEFGRTAYPEELGDYYLDWLPLFNNVQIVRNARVAWYRRLPPLRYWLGPRRYVLQDLRVEGFDGRRFARFHNALYFFVTVALPVFGLLCCAGAAVPPRRRRDPPP